MSNASVKATERRTFLGILLGVIGAAVAGAFGWSSFRYLAPIEKNENEKQVRIARQQVAVGGAYFFTYLGRPAVVLQPEPGEYLALSAVCTHLGCIVKWVDGAQEFLCPCHGGRFSTTGQVLGGPPPSPLQNYGVSVAGNEILIG